MMFLEFFIWGAWFVTMGSYLTGSLGFSGAESALAYSTQSWGAIIAPFIIGLIADKYVNAERLLGVIHLIGAALMYLLASATQFDGFYPYLFALHDPVHADARARQRDLVSADGRPGAPLRHYPRLGHGRLDRRGARDQLFVRLGLAGRYWRQACCATRS